MSCLSDFSPYREVPGYYLGNSRDSAAPANHSTYCYLHHSKVSFLAGLIKCYLFLNHVHDLTIFLPFSIRKKKPKANRSSIYMPKGKPILPGNATFPKTRADNESHVYASIEDQPVVDGNTGAWSNGHQVDIYRPFTGPNDSISQVKEPSPDYTLDRGDGRAGDQASYQPFLNPINTFMPTRPRTPLISQSSLGFEDRRMVQNELNTFKSAGDINPIRLSTEESRLPPLLDSDSDSFQEPEYEEAM